MFSMVEFSGWMQMKFLRAPSRCQSEVVNSNATRDATISGRVGGAAPRAQINGIWRGAAAAVLWRPGLIAFGARR